MINVYTDCSTSGDTACIAFIAVNFIDGLYLCSGTVNYRHNKNSICEVYAVRDALRFLVKNYDLSYEDVTIFTDFAFNQNLWSKHKNGQYIRSSLFREIIFLSKYCKNLDIRHVKGHVSDFTPNKACDILAKRYREVGK